MLGRRLLFVLVWVGACLAAAASSQSAAAAASLGELVALKVARLSRGGGAAGLSSGGSGEGERAEAAIALCRKALAEDPTRMKARFAP
jgi:hypothetical protein